MENTEEVLQQLHPILEIQQKLNIKEAELPISTLWRFLDKPSGHPVMLSIPDYGRQIVYFTPLIQKLRLTTDTGTIDYDLRPIDEDEVTIIQQIQHIQQVNQAIGNIIQKDLTEPSFITIKWTPTNHYQNMKLKAKIFAYYTFLSSEMDQQKSWYSEMKEHTTIQLQKNYQSRPQGFKLSDHKTVPNSGQKQQNSDLHFPVELHNYLRKPNQPKQIIFRYINAINTKWTDSRPWPNYYIQSNILKLGKDIILNNKELLMLQNILHESFSANVSNYQDIFGFWCQIIDCQAGQNLNFDEILGQVHGIFNNNILQLRAGSQGLSTVQLLANILYFRQIKKKANFFYPKRYAQGGQTQQPSLLKITRPFISNKKNEFFNESQQKEFLSSIENKEVENAIYDFSDIMLNKFGVNQSTEKYLELRNGLFSGNDTEEINQIISSPVFQLTENIRNIQQFKIGLIEQNNEQVKQLQANAKTQQQRQQIVMRRCLQINSDSVDMNQVGPDRVRQIYYQHYYRYFNEFMLNSENKSCYSTTSKYHGRQAVRSRPLASTFYSQQVQTMYHISTSQFLKSNVKQMSSRIQSISASFSRNPQLLAQAFGHIRDSNDMATVERLRDYNKMARYILLQKPMQNVIALSRVGFQVADCDSVINVDGHIAQHNRKVIKQEIGHVYGIEGNEISMKIESTTQPAVGGTTNKFMLKETPDE